MGTANSQVLSKDRTKTFARAAEVAIFCWLQEITPSVRWFQTDVWV